MTFYEWLNTRKITDDPQGDLLADMRRDPAVKTVETWQRLTQVIPGDLHEYAWPLWVAYRAKKFGERLPEVPPVPEGQGVAVMIADSRRGPRYAHVQIDATEVGSEEALDHLLRGLRRQLVLEGFYPLTEGGAFDSFGNWSMTIGMVVQCNPDRLAEVLDQFRKEMAGVKLWLRSREVDPMEADQWANRNGHVDIRGARLAYLGRVADRLFPVASQSLEPTNP